MDFKWFSTRRSDTPKDGDVTDAELVRRVCAGDREAEEYLFGDHLISAVSFLARRYKYEDLPGELYVHLREDAWRRLKTWKGESSLRTWLSQVAVHLCLTQARTSTRVRGHEVLGSDLEAVAPFTPHDELLAAYDRAVLLSGIESLREARDRLLLRGLCAGRSLTEIAEELHVPQEHVYVVRDRAVKRLRKVVQDAIAE